MSRLLHGIAHGLHDGALMAWMTWWPLVAGFSLSGIVQAVVPRNGLRARLGGTGLAPVLWASLLGVLSSSCSYAASAMARALFVRGARLRHAIIFMVASTNLVVELGIVLWLLLGWQFLAAEIVGGCVMIALIALAGSLLTRHEESLRAGISAPDMTSIDTPPWRHAVRQRATWERVAGYVWGDLRMLRNELVGGFIVAGFLAACVPALWWQRLFVSGHGWWPSVENAVVAPLVAVLSFVCSVGNVPLAAALWQRGISFGAVVAFILADLVTLPLLLSYRRLFDRATAVRLGIILWATMSVAGIAVDGLSRVGGFHARRHPIMMAGDRFTIGPTFFLNLAATVVLVLWWWLRRHGAPSELTCIDPVCHMQVDRAAPAATFEVAGETYYFCAPSCATKFSANPDRYLGTMLSSPTGSHVDPICGMHVDPDTAAASVTVDGTTTYFCATGCRDQFLAGPSAPPGTTMISLNRKPRP
jgi:YHS domain-containing protein/uncharacterized membrane protein YraQ (UPF0718 family)